uniref:Reticulocalbin-3 n=1 Tax=Soboliphyme baturini TaxID=241478 RepID=A0A183IMB8_9BILA
LKYFASCCSVLCGSFAGSKKTAEEFDTLSPNESKRRLRILAKKMDINQDGFVDFEELVEWIKTSLRQLDEEELDERFEEADENHDGKISWEEYKKEAFGDDNDFSMENPDDRVLLSVEDLLNLGRLSSKTKLMEEDRRYFTAADMDGNGLLTKEEFYAFQNPENHPHMHRSLIDSILKEKDSNKDGFIDMKEYLGEYAHTKENEWYSIEQGRFREYDKNDDGKLDTSEMKDWLVPDVNETANAEAKHLMSEADANDDGKLSYVEIENQYGLFVGSEATSYGEQLKDIVHEEL